MADELTAETFEPHVGETFVVDADATDSLALQLVALNRGGHQPGAPRTDPFTLEFDGDAQRPLPQATYSFTHDGLGSFDIFLVPLGVSDGKIRYEAVFN